MIRTSILLHNPSEAMFYRERLRNRFPRITVDLVDHHNKVDR